MATFEHPKKGKSWIKLLVTPKMKSVNESRLSGRLNFFTEQNLCSLCMDPLSFIFVAVLISSR